MKKADLGIAAYLLCAVIFFIIPIPSILLDVMLMVNISIALDHPVQCTVCTGNLRDVIFPNVIAVYHTVQNFSEHIFHTSDPDNRRPGNVCRDFRKFRWWR